MRVRTLWSRFWRNPRVAAGRLALLTAFGIGLAVGLFVLIASLSRGLSDVDWTAIGALAGLGAALATSAAVAALWFAASGLEAQAKEIEAQARDERISRKPYLRVDIGFVEEPGRHPGFTPPSVEYLFGPDDFQLQGQLEPMAELAPTDEDEVLTLAIWVSNLQSAALGIAYQVQAEVGLTWRTEQGTEVGLAVAVEFAYVEPGQTTAVQLGRVRRGIPWFVAWVENVTYQDIFGAEVMFDRHGAQLMLYDREGDKISNDRSYNLNR